MPLVSPIQLREYFELLSGIYTQSEDGKTLGEWFKADWNLFESLDLANTKDLLSDIFEDGNLPRSLFSPSSRCDSDNLNKWEFLRKELMEENRFFPKGAIDSERITYLLSQLIYKAALPAKWYRARIQETDEAFPLEKMGPPPKDKATHGRANPVGIPYLYMASNIETAITEIRPHTGEYVTVAEFELIEELKLADLRNPRRSVTPFPCTDEIEIASLRGDIDFLAKLGEELTRPVLPRSAAVDYIPSQYLCELIKNNGYDGVIYKSSVGNEINIALFYPAKARGIQTIPHRVLQVSVNAQPR
ncbi:RES family NAD+ phosphorylase [Pseudomonas sp. FP1740]|uniref:RES family NAD+ phosphorylase n=1 Tax=Pseudomonas sp. FP1740 TaxID=2954078 RepID=UPI002737159C|nr:RES family NAD+ phosphorylase [Pseudomonas sp. FP1740]WLG45220.1 RES family NAD+ phosphorylase [Pseudomonas sp. FP1740]